jgi:hypothetical protein
LILSKLIYQNWFYQNWFIKIGIANFEFNNFLRILLCEDRGLNFKLLCLSWRLHKIYGPAAGIHAGCPHHGNPAAHSWEFRGFPAENLRPRCRNSRSLSHSIHTEVTRWRMLVGAVSASNVSNLVWISVRSAYTALLALLKMSQICVKNDPKNPYENTQFGEINVRATVFEHSLDSSKFVRTSRWENFT